MSSDPTTNDAPAAPADPSPEPTPAPAPSPPPPPAPAPPSPPAPALTELAQKVEDARAAYLAAKDQADASDAKAKAYAAARDQAHADLRAAIAACVNATNAEDP